MAELRGELPVDAVASDVSMEDQNELEQELAEEEREAVEEPAHDARDGAVEVNDGEEGSVGDACGLLVEFLGSARKVKSEALALALVNAGFDTDTAKGLLTVVKELSDANEEVKEKKATKRQERVIATMKIPFQTLYQKFKDSTTNIEALEQKVQALIVDSNIPERIASAANIGAITKELELAACCVANTNRLQIYNYFLIGKSLRAAAEWFTKHKGSVADTFKTFIEQTPINGKTYEHSYATRLMRLADLCTQFPRLCFVDCTVSSFLTNMPTLVTYLRTHKKEAEHWATVRRKDNNKGIALKFANPPPIHIPAYDRHEFPARYKRFREESDKYAEQDKKARKEATEEARASHKVSKEEAEDIVDERADEGRDY